jgi:hypothetical protein
MVAGMNRRAFLASLPAATFTLAARGMDDLDVHGHSYPFRDPKAGDDLRRIGAGRWKWKGLVPVYSSALYLRDPADTARLVDPLPRALVLRYYRDVGKQDMVDAADHYLRRNLTREQLAAIAPGLAQLNALYRDVRKDDTYHLVYRPESGTRLVFNGALLGTVPGAAFGPLYFTVWLGEESVSDRLRDEMFGRV